MQRGECSECDKYSQCMGWLMSVKSEPIIILRAVLASKDTMKCHSLSIISV